MQISVDETQQNPELPVQDWSSQKHGHSHPAPARVSTPEGTALAQPALLLWILGSMRAQPASMDRGVTADLLHCA